MRWSSDISKEVRAGLCSVSIVFCYRTIVAVLAVIICVAFPMTRAAAQTEPSAPEEIAPVTIPLVELTTESESATATVRDIRGDLGADSRIAAASKQLPSITREIDSRLRENRKILAQSPSIEMLRGIEGEWRRVRREVYGINQQLTSRINELERNIERLRRLGDTWEKTGDAAKASKAPAEVIGRIEAVSAGIRQAREAVEKERARALTVQNRLGVQESRITDAVTTIGQAREHALSLLLQPDSPPLWNMASHAPTAQALQDESRNSLARQWPAVIAYGERHGLQLLILVGIAVFLAMAFHWVHRRGRQLATSGNEFGSAFSILDSPLAPAVLVSLSGARWLFPQAPRLFWAALGALALVPSTLILRRLVRPDFQPLLVAVIGFFLLDQVRSVAAAVPALPRLLLISEMIGVLLICVLMIRKLSGHPAAARWVRATAYAATLLAAAALLATILGYVTLGNLLGNALLQSSYTGAILYALAAVLDALVAIALTLQPLAALPTVQRHRSLLRRRIRLLLYAVAAGLWTLVLLQRLLLRERLFTAVREFLAAEITFGAVHLTPGDVFAFAITVWAAFLISRFVRFLLDEEVFPRVGLQRGLPYAISNTLHYLILVVGFFLAVAALGFDMTRVTILAGAFSVGVGFGLQNIFNNFISGLILLFERPIKIGDVVQIEDTSGGVERIGVRASIIRTSNGSEIIMPNGKLISERVINWTLSSRQHGIELPVAVAQGTDPGKIIDLLEKTAAAHPLVNEDPRPQALVVKLGPDSLGFELRAWTDRAERWMEIRSDLAIAISSNLAAEKIAIR